MITRLFRVRVPLALHAEFEPKFLRVSLPYVQQAAGLVTVSVAGPSCWSPEEYLMISIWENQAALQAFAGPQWNEAVIPSGMEKYVAECWVHHYQGLP